jgi:hypothetical protein
MAKNNWFSVDKEGLAQVYARRGPAAPFYELISNAWDEEGVREVTLTVTAVPGQPKVEVRCEDDSTEGFVDLEEARVLFAPSKKKGEAEQRGRFNIGEKLFLSLCTEASIVSTGGTLRFNADGTTRRARGATEQGTVVTATMRMTREDAIEAFHELDRLITPTHIRTVITFEGFGEDVQGYIHTAPRGNCTRFEAQLQTELAGEDGVIRQTERIAEVEAWRIGATDGWLYEMGIPVVEIGGPFNVNVTQKVPLNVDRDNVRPAFLRRVRAHVLNEAFVHITSEDDARAPWVDEAMGSQNPKPTADALRHIMDLRFGKKRVAYDPSDKEGSQIAMSKGYTVVHGGSLPADVWENVRETETIRPAGKVTPSSAAVFSEHGEDVSIPREQYPPGGVEVCDAFELLGSELIGKHVEVRIVKRLQSSSGRAPAACYGDRTILLNLRKLGKAWFKRTLDEGTLSQDQLRLLVHELGHEYSGSHLNERFHESQTRLGVKLAFMAATSGFDADLFQITKKTSA